MYCVAPVGQPRASENGTVHDVWAVGTNCCSGNAGEFRCGDSDDPDAHSGLRLLDTPGTSLGFYRLAVQQAAAKYGLEVRHAIFVSWERDPQAALRRYQT